MQGTAVCEALLCTLILPAHLAAHLTLSGECLKRMFDAPPPSPAVCGILGATLVAHNAAVSTAGPTCNDAIVHVRSRAKRIVSMQRRVVVHMA
jgi:hypothetical protein